MGIENLEAEPTRQQEAAGVEAFQTEWLEEQAVPDTHGFQAAKRQEAMPEDLPSLSIKDNEQGLSDIRKTLIHLAEYNCKFEEREEFAAKIGKYLKAFSEDQNQSPGMRAAQELVSELLKNPDQEGFAKFTREFQKLRIRNSSADQLRMNELESLTEKEMQKPERKEAEREHKDRLHRFFADLDQLPKDEKNRIMCLIDWQDNVSAAERDQRVLDGLKSRPELQDTFTETVEARKRLDNLKGSFERELNEELRQKVRDNVLLRAIPKIALQWARIIWMTQRYS